MGSTEAGATLHRTPVRRAIRRNKSDTTRWIRIGASRAVGSTSKVEKTVSLGAQPHSSGIPPLKKIKSHNRKVRTKRKRNRTM